MSIEDIVKAWKSEEKPDADIPSNPAGEELSEDELAEVIGGRLCQVTNWGCQTDTSCPYSVLV